ncbi:hypothetical protein Sps_03021 [Shewanella psychrophila]|uniref:Uncharacterized protein n=1 Tax=Shewanella psychrophila TaxID=225848 RepID=A0A1S6HRP5_9GAMM|nr:hypothetical protein [Shewanella psychrophila]AQS38168.1 hypothetical protein Sps_03021 [Shewanella psychrophila]
MNELEHRTLYGEMGMLGIAVSALPFFFIALTTLLWWFGIIGLIVCFFSLPFKQIVSILKLSKLFCLISSFMLVLAIYAVYSFIAWRGVSGYLLYFATSFIWSALYYFNRVER